MTAAKSIKSWTTRTTSACVVALPSFERPFARGSLGLGMSSKGAGFPKACSWRPHRSRRSTPFAFVCLCGDEDEDHGRLFHGGCACRGTAGFAHVDCYREAAKAAHSLLAEKSLRPWSHCHTCQRALTGRLGLEMAAEAYDQFHELRVTTAWSQAPASSRTLSPSTASPKLSPRCIARSLRSTRESTESTMTRRSQASSAFPNAS
mmetsp:Transcript_13646/g.41241  ORF Transcript_13646/g.41241 Transcript_13646/m.41241 type:complete len:205 (-) Transcript_13646:736-1350(-)